MNDIRARFEEIWPVPDGVEFCDVFGGYWHKSTQDKLSVRFREHDIRLDTFTRCQETTDVYVSLVDEFIGELDCIERAKDIWLPEVAEEQHMEEMYALHAMRTRYLETLNRAKQIMEQKK